MRPLKLTLRGINSYRKEQTIDFETLTSAGLFGIFGPTGSGKSSILDAITLALYARLPRSTKNFPSPQQKPTYTGWNALSAIIRETPAPQCATPALLWQI